MNTRINSQEKDNSQIIRDGGNVFELLEGIRSNLSKLFLQTGSKKKLHEKYIRQRQERAWDFAMKVDHIIKKYPSNKQLVTIYSTVLRDIQIAAGTKTEVIDETFIASVAQSMAAYPIDKEKPNISIIMSMLERMGMTRAGVERFLSGSLDREISQKMNQ